MGLLGFPGAHFGPPRLGAHFLLPGAPGTCYGPPGAFQSSFGASLSFPGLIFGLLEPPRAHFRRSGASRGTSRGSFSTSWNLPGLIFGFLSLPGLHYGSPGSFAHFGPPGLPRLILGLLEPPWAHFWRVTMLHWGTSRKLSFKRVEINYEKQGLNWRSCSRPCTLLRP